MSEIQNEERRRGGAEENDSQAEQPQQQQDNKQAVEQPQDKSEKQQKQEAQQQSHQQVQAEVQQEESPPQVEEKTEDKEQQSQKQQEENKEQQQQENEEQYQQANEAENQQIQRKSSQQQIQQENQEPIIIQTPVVQKKQVKKVPKPKKVQKSKSQHAQNLSFDQLLKYILKENKMLRVIFNHFCKENNLISIKSTLFQEKQKKSQQMSLNKWMVFCKEFQIYSKLCKIKNNARQARVASNQLALQTSQIRQLHRVKQAKQVQKTLMGIFKHSNKNASKINFQSYVFALSKIYYDFKQFYPQTQKGIDQFLCEVMYCSDEKSCYKKLSHLKFTSATPQIQYNKLNFSEGQLKAKVKAVLSKTKQNYQSRMHTLSYKEKTQTITHNYTKLYLNPVLVEAKRSLNTFNSYSKRGHNNKLSLAKLTPNLLKPKQNEHQTQLISYFETTKDPILDSYFMLESGKKMSEIHP